MTMSMTEYDYEYDHYDYHYEYNYEYDYEYHYDYEYESLTDWVWLTDCQSFDEESVYLSEVWRLYKLVVFFFITKILTPRL